MEAASIGPHAGIIEEGIGTGTSTMIGMMVLCVFTCLLLVAQQQPQSASHLLLQHSWLLQHSLSHLHPSLHLQLSLQQHSLLVQQFLLHLHPSLHLQSSLQQHPSLLQPAGANVLM